MFAKNGNASAFFMGFEYGAKKAKQQIVIVDVIYKAVFWGSSLHIYPSLLRQCEAWFKNWENGIFCWQFALIRRYEYDLANIPRTIFSEINFFL